MEDGQPNHNTDMAAQQNRKCTHKPNIGPIFTHWDRIRSLGLKLLRDWSPTSRITLQYNTVYLGGEGCGQCELWHD